ncbi:UTP--glucose-1-phosphate uridylyltransferase [Candidatus Gracilibacteria bacterium GN02-872]|nr:UTP--glucose-1-phosphate uridylyltransferase [Candidatus Gracilibacteria bacterium GN02-872]RKW21936.1 MAG: UTP--glucose-1-phosphate uridylyltransferase [Candidatus Gracilibacteria bacterium]
MRIKKCIIPAAGMGTRFLPATKALPKEMFPIIDKPVMQLLVEEAVSAGCEEIIIITGRSKRAIEDHFDANIELERRLSDDGKNNYLATVRGVNNLANIAYIRQPYPKGDGDAILRAKNFIGNEPFLVLFGDDLVDGEKAAAVQLTEAFEKTGSPVIATVTVSDKEVSSYGIIESDDSGELFKVKKFFEKPKSEETASRHGVIGKYILTPDIFEYLEKSTPIGGDGETRLADAFELMRKEKDIFGVEIKGERYDTGNKVGFLKANIAYGLKNEELKEDLKDYLKEIVKNFN